MYILFLHKGLLIPNTNPSLHIAFDAMISGSRDYVGHADVTIVFDEVLTNRGDAYQKKTLAYLLHLLLELIYFLGQFEVIRAQVLCQACLLTE